MSQRPPIHPEHGELAWPVMNSADKAPRRSRSGWDVLLGAVIGAVVGAVVGGGVGGAIADARSCHPYTNLCELAAIPGIFFGVLAGVVLGGVLGGLINGVLFRSKRRPQDPPAN